MNNPKVRPNHNGRQDVYRIKKNKDDSTGAKIILNFHVDLINKYKVNKKAATV